MSRKTKRIIACVGLILVCIALFSINVFAAKDAVGDLNRDGDKNKNDAFHLLGYVIFEELYDVDQPCDYDGNGKIDKNDAFYLLGNTVSEEQYPICDHSEDKWSVGEVIAPTCNEKGYTIMVCKCGEEEITDYTDIDDTAHTWGDVNEDNKATCLENGYTTITCGVCGAVETTYQQATGHDWTGGSCTEPKTCPNCDATEPAIGHVYGKTPVESIEATCKGGYNLYKCENCDDTYREELEKTEHTVADDGWTDKGDVAVEGKACTYVHVEVGICGVCEAEVERSSEEFKKHTEVTTVVAATCTAKGEKTVKCGVCEEQLSKDPIEVDPEAHGWKEDAENSTASATAYKCEYCNATKSAVIVDSNTKVNITKTDEVKLESGAEIVPDEATKEQLGNTSVSVSVEKLGAGDIGNLSEEDKKLLGDSPVFNLEMSDAADKPITDFDGYITVRLPYELSEGEDPDCIIIWYIDEGDGSEDAEVSIEYIEAKYVNGFAVFKTNHFSYYTATRMTPAQRCKAYGHNDQTTDVPATCVTGGYTLTICTRCGNKVTSDPIDALGHKWTPSMAEEATCTTSGTEHYDCDRCDAEYDKKISATGHDYQLADHIEPTCTTNGSNTYKCENCSDEYSEEIPQLEHEYETEDHAADCNKDGYKHHKCKHCKHEYDSDHKKAHGHKYGKNGKCEHCDDECKHEYKYGVCVRCKHEKEKPVKPESPDHKHEFVYSYEFLSDIKLCDEGVAITITCTGCDYKESFETDECYTWTVHVDLSQYDVCENHVLDYEICPCGDSFEFVNDPCLDEQLSFDTDEETYQTSVYGCEHCNLIATVDMRVEAINKCIVNRTVNYTFSIGDEIVEDIKLANEDENHDYTVEFEFKDGATSCEDGVLVTSTCEKCGEVKVDEYTDHELVCYTDHYFTDHGCETHRIETSHCPCGKKYGYVMVEGFDGRRHIYDEEGSKTVYYCNSCDLEVYVSYAVETDENCFTVQTNTYTVKFGEEVIKALSCEVFSYYNHEWDTVATLKEGATSCTQGVIIDQTCRVCGATEFHETNEHEEFYQILDLSKYNGCDNHAIEIYGCACGDNISSTYWDWNSFMVKSVGENQTLHYCNNCGISILETEIEGEKEENGCWAAMTWLYDIKNGDEVIFNGMSTGRTESHEYETTVKLVEGAKSCKDGVIITRQCVGCGIKEENIAYDHSYEETSIDLSDYDVCDMHTISRRICEYCGEEGSINWKGFDNQTTNNDGWDLFCSDCDINIHIVYEWVDGDNCYRAQVNTYTVTVGEDVILTVKAEVQARYYHEWKTNATFTKEGATSCKEGVTIEQFCTICGVSEKHETTEHETFERYLDLSKYNGCESHNISMYACVCGEVCNSMFWEYDTFNYTQVSSNQGLYACENCDITILETETRGERDENCRVYITWLYEVSNGKDTIMVGNGRGSTEDHDRVTTVTLKEGAVSCEGGVIVKDVCIHCGSGSEWETTEHYAGVVEKVEFADLGHKCGTGSVWTYSCACGEEQGARANFNGFSKTKNTETINGLLYSVTTYTCRDCKYSFVWKENHTSDEFCNLTVHVMVSVDGENVLDSVTKHGQAHNSITSKELPDECSDVTHEDGTRTKTETREYYCENCFASLNKIKYVYEYDADENIVEAIETRYDYVAISETETISVLSNVHETKNIIVKNALDGGVSAVVDYEKDTYYAEGKETSWDEYDYVYTDGDYCNRTIIYRNAFGGENSYRETDMHLDGVYKYVLSDGSKTCTDGIDRVWYCLRCGEEVYREENCSTNHEMEYNSLTCVDAIDLEEYGSVCGGTLNVYACACGDNKDISLDGKCDFDLNSYRQKAEDGKYHNYDVYTCAVTDPEKCGFKYVIESWSSSDENCNLIEYRVIYLGVDETNTTYKDKYEFTSKAGRKSHAKLITETTFNGDESRVDVVKCSACGLIEEKSEISNHIKTRERYTYRADGLLTNKNTNKYLYPFDSHNKHYPIILEFLSESFDKDGNVSWWRKETRNYTKADEGNYCYYSTTVTYSSGYSETTEVEENHLIYSAVDNWPCVYDETEFCCHACGEIFVRNESWGGHDYYYDEEKQTYVCINCGLESVSGGDGKVIFEYLSADEGNGTEYIIGFINNYGESYIWNISLVVDGAEDFIMLDNVKVEQINDYRLKIDAQAVVDAAKALGYDTCEYMVRVAFVPTDANGEIDYAITLDPHIWLADAENNVVPESGCSSEEAYGYAYKCSLCSSSKLENEYGHKYVWVEYCNVLHNDGGELVVTHSAKRTCTRCDLIYEETTVTTYRSNGTIKSEESNDYKSTYEYDYENGFYMITREYLNHTRIASKVEKRCISTDETIYVTTYYKDGSWSKFEEVNDYENNTRIETTTMSNGEVSIQKYYISNSRLFESRHENESRISLYKYIWYNDNIYASENYYEDSEGSWIKTVYEYNFKEDVKIETTTRSDTDKVNVTKYSISTGEVIL